MIKVQQANAIYEHTAACLARCHGAGVKFSIENPTNSIMWLTKWMQPLLAMGKVSEMKFQQCRWGGKRGKWSSWYTNWPQLHDLAGPCPSGHAHLPWGAVFKGKNYSVATAEEAEYLRALCTKIAAMLKSEAFEMGIHVVEAAKSADEAKWLQVRAQAGKQCRGNKLPQVIPEFKEMMHIPVPEEVGGALRVALGARCPHGDPVQGAVV